MPSTAQSSSYSGDVTSDAITAIICEDGGIQKAVQADLPLNASSERTIESTNPPLDTQTEESMTTSNLPATSTEHQPPSSPMMDLESDFPSGETFNLSKKNNSWCTAPQKCYLCTKDKHHEETYPTENIHTHTLTLIHRSFVCYAYVFAEPLDQKPSAPQRGVKRPRDSSYSRKRVIILISVLFKIFYSTDFILWEEKCLSVFRDYLANSF